MLNKLNVVNKSYAVYTKSGSFPIFQINVMAFRKKVLCFKFISYTVNNVIINNSNAKFRTNHRSWQRNKVFHGL